MTKNEVLKELRALEDDQIRAVNARHGDAHSVNLTALRALAKRIKSDHALASELWSTTNSDARLLATLICKPKQFSADELDHMVGLSATPKELDWLVSYVVKENKHKEELRLRFKDAKKDFVASAGWMLTTERVVKNPEGLDLTALLDEIERDMKKASPRKQWSMNHCLAEIGIRNAKLRARAVKIGEKLKVLIDYPASPGCTPPYAPVWIAEMVKRQKSA